MSSCALELRRAFFALALAASMVAPWSLGASSAAAQSDHDEEEARSLFEAGRSAYEAGRYDDALEHFERSYEISGRPQLLFNIAAAADRLLQYQRALDSYRAYLEALPEAPNRELVERRIELLSTQVPAAPAAEPEPETNAVPGTTATESTSADLTPWIVLGASAAVAIGGGVMLVLGELDAQAVRDAEMGSTWAELEPIADRGEALQLAGWVALGVGLAGATAAVVWGVTAPSGARIEMAFGPGRVALRGEF